MSNKDSSKKRARSTPLGIVSAVIAGLLAFICPLLLGILGYDIVYEGNVFLSHNLTNDVDILKSEFEVIQMMDMTTFGSAVSSFAKDVLIYMAMAGGACYGFALFIVAIVQACKAGARKDASGLRRAGVRAGVGFIGFSFLVYALAYGYYGYEIAFPFINLVALIATGFLLLALLVIGLIDNHAKSGKGHRIFSLIIAIIVFAGLALLCLPPFGFSEYGFSFLNGITPVMEYFPVQDSETGMNTPLIVSGVASILGSIITALAFFALMGLASESLKRAIGAKRDNGADGLSSCILGIIWGGLYIAAAYLYCMYFVQLSQSEIVLSMLTFGAPVAPLVALILVIVRRVNFPASQIEDEPRPKLTLRGFDGKPLKVKKTQEAE